MRLTRSFLSTAPGISEMLRKNLSRARQDSDPHLLSTETIDVIHQLKGEAQVLGLAGVGELLGAAEKALGALKEGVDLTPDLAETIDEALDQLSHLPNDPVDAAAVDAGHTVQRIRAALDAARRMSSRAPRG